LSLLPVNQDLTNLDFDSIRNRLIALIKSVYPEWSDFDTASFGNLLLEMYAFVGDTISFYLNKQARESRLVTATQRKNVIALARMLGANLHGAQAATASVELTLSKPPVANVVIPAGTIVRTKEITDPIKMQLATDATFTTVLTQAVAIAEHSKSHNELFDSKGLANLDVQLNYKPYLDGSVIVAAGNGIFTEVSSFLGSTANDLHYTVIVDQNDRATVRFGNGANGAIPTGTIQVVYKTGGGESGNIEAGRISVIEGAFVDAHGNPVQVSVTNPEPSSGGVNRQTIQSAKLLIPESLRANTRTVTREDFEINARNVPGVARALMTTSNEDPAISENSGILYIIPSGGGNPTPALKNVVLIEVTENKPCTLTFTVNVQNPVYKIINIEARVHTRRGYDKQTVRELIKSNLSDWFKISNDDGTPNSNVDFGYKLEEIAYSDVYNIIRDTDGVRKISDNYASLKLNSLPADLKLGVSEFPVLSTVTLIDSETGQYL